jgi:hypothetical protein
MFPVRYELYSYTLFRRNNIPYLRVYYITKLFKQQAEVIQNHENKHVHSIGQGETRHRKYFFFPSSSTAPTGPWPPITVS